MRLSWIYISVFAFSHLNAVANTENDCVTVSAVEGPCTLARYPLTELLPTPLDHPAIFYSTPGTKPRNAAFADLVNKEALSVRLGHENVRLTSSNAYSDGEVELPLATYLKDLEMSSSACASSRDAVYLFGGNYR